MLMDRLPFLVVLCIQQAIGTSKRLGVLIRFEAPVANFVVMREFLIAQAVVTEHEVVIGLEVLRINGQHGLQLLYGVGVLRLEEENASQIIERHAVLRILREDGAKMFGRAIIVAVIPQDFGIKEVRAGKLRMDFEGRVQHDAGAVHVSSLDRRTANIHPAIRVLWINLGNFLEGSLRTFQVSLQEHSDTIVIPALPLFGVQFNLRGRRRCVLDQNAPAPAPKVELNAKEWQRWNDYGIGMFLQGDLKGAQAAFQKVTEIDPKNPDGWVNIGRAAVQEGDMDRARIVLKRALEINPKLARTNFFYAKVLRNDGDYDGAAEHLRTVLTQYPQDRVALNDLGRILFLKRQYADAIKQLQVVLAIDPEDLQANYNLMLCYNGLGDQKLAHDYEVRYRRFKADENAQALTGPYRLLNAEDNQERQAIHEHVSAPLETTVAAARTRKEKLAQSAKQPKKTASVSASGTSQQAWR